jgi:hypothetical protein
MVSRATNQFLERFLTQTPTDKAINILRNAIGRLLKDKYGQDEPPIEFILINREAEHLGCYYPIPNVTEDNIDECLDRAMINVSAANTDLQYVDKLRRYYKNAKTERSGKPDSPTTTKEDSALPGGLQ